MKCGQDTYSDAQLQRNDRQRKIINDIKQIIGLVETEDRDMPKPHWAADVTKVGGSLADECREYRRKAQGESPTITAIALHETRPTSNYTKMKAENSKQVTYVDRSSGHWKPMPPAPWELPRKPSQELRASNLYQNCDCLKRNGLQHECPRWYCGGRPECVAVNPGPCCWTSQARKPVRGDRRYPPEGYTVTEHQAYGS